ncbi:hypothetical protein DFH28DRAFT_1195812 [Melampsora americana]|nr:hypothetical protein DFH28DRAFT_1195812 [Melampsora americana]
MPINTRSRKKTPPGATNLRGQKRRKQLETERDDAETQRRSNLQNQQSNQTQPQSRQTQSNSNPSNEPDNRSQEPPCEALDLEDINVHNYEPQKKFWSLHRIEQQLKAQTADNRSQPNPLILAEAKAIHEAFEHSLHMLAMISKIPLNALKSHLGIGGGTRAPQAWNQFLGFSTLAYQHPMPLRNDPDAGEILTRRNKANSDAYDQLTDDEYAIFTSRIFHALGGYPDYSAISVEDHQNAGDCDVLVPEVPSLSPREEALYRPIYEKLVDLAKVAKHRERFKAPSAEKREKLSLRAFKKRLQELHHDATLADFDYYAIGCSKTLGTGWCEEFTSLPEISTWIEDRLKFQVIFPMYSQGKPDFNEIQAAAWASGKASHNTNKNSFTRVANRSDRESTELTSLLLAQIEALGITLTTRGFPRGPNPPGLFEKHKMNVIFLTQEDSAMSYDKFMLGFDGMKTRGRRNWLQDMKDQKFLIVLKGSPVTAPWKLFKNNNESIGAGGDCGRVGSGGSGTGGVGGGGDGSVTGEVGGGGDGSVTGGVGGGGDGSVTGGVGGGDDGNGTGEVGGGGDGCGTGGVGGGADGSGTGGVGGHGDGSGTGGVGGRGENQGEGDNACQV